MNSDPARRNENLQALIYIRGLAQRNIQRIKTILQRAGNEKVGLTAAQLRVYHRSVEDSRAVYTKHHQKIIALSSPADREQQDDIYFEFVALYEEVSVAIESRLEWVRALPIQQPQPDSCQRQLVSPEEASLPSQDRDKVGRSKQVGPAESESRPGLAARVHIPAGEPFTSSTSPNTAGSKVPERPSKVPESSSKVAESSTTTTNRDFMPASAARVRIPASAPLTTQVSPNTSDSKVPESSTTTTNRDSFSLFGGEYVQSDKRTEKRARGDERERSASQSASSSRRDESIKTRAPARCIISNHSTTIAAISNQQSNRRRRKSKRASHQWPSPRPPEEEQEG